MTDLVVATPVFLDLTFVGLEALPALGEERFAGELLRSPGGGAITAVGAARLGLTASIAAPLGDDVAGDIVRGLLAEERVERPVDTTGAGDLLTAAYIWADLRGSEPAQRLRWAVLYATLAVTTATGIGGAVTEARLLEEGAARGLVPPPLAAAI